MAPASNMRKSSATTMAAAEPPTNPALGSLYQPRRTNSGRAIRVNTTRPANYYARPFGSFSAAGDHDANMDAGDVQAHGFYPGLQYFTDAITALPKEVIKQFTLMKEVEAKIHGPSEKLGQLIDHLMAQPVPTQRHASGNGIVAAQQGLLSFTAHNSISGSTNASMINGVIGRQDPQSSVNGSVNDEEQVETQEEIARRMGYGELCKHLKSLIPNLDEKYGVLEEANRVLALQELRMESVMPQIENEISEESRLGSMSHWAYADNRQKRHAANAANRRDVASAHNLAAAANLIHENEISNARIHAGREAAREKTKGKRVEHPVDSDFDEKPKKQKLSKAKAAALAAAGPSSLGLGISATGETLTNKRKKASEKGAAAVGMERTVSAPGRGSKANRDPPRSAPALETAAVKKAAKAKPAPAPVKKKLPASAHGSPMLASSPLASSFTIAATETPSSARPQSARLRHTTAATNLRHERTQEQEDVSRPETPATKNTPVSSNTNVATSKDSKNDTTELTSSAIGVSGIASNADGSSGSSTSNGSKINGKKRAIDAEVEEDKARAEADRMERQLKEASERLKREEAETSIPAAEVGPSESHAGSNGNNENNNKSSSRGSGVSTPKLESVGPTDAGMVRTRSARGKSSARADGRESSSSEPAPTAPNKHRRVASNSHLVKQLAPFNRSPDLDRHRVRDDMEEDLESPDEKTVVDEDDKQESSAGKDAEAVADRAARRASTRRPTSSRNGGPLRTTPPIESRESTPEETDAPSPPAPPSTRQQRNAQAAARAPQPAPIEDEDEDDSEHDPDDPNETKYCYCNRGSYGDMVACDNDECPREWFHLGCTELREAPGEEEVWYCRECRPKFTRKTKGRAGRGG